MSRGPTARKLLIGCLLFLPQMICFSTFVLGMRAKVTWLYILPLCSYWDWDYFLTSTILDFNIVSDVYEQGLTSFNPEYKGRLKP